MSLDTQKLKPDPEPPRKLHNLKRSKPKEKAVGAAAVTNSLKHINEQGGTTRGTKALYRLNQKDGFQ